MIKCPFCHFENEDGALFCERCTSDLSSVAPPAKPGAAAATPCRGPMPVAGHSDGRGRCPQRPSDHGRSGSVRGHPDGLRRAGGRARRWPRWPRRAHRMAMPMPWSPIPGADPAAGADAGSPVEADPAPPPPPPPPAPVRSSAPGPVAGPARGARRLPRLPRRSRAEMPPRRLAGGRPAAPAGAARSAPQR